MWLSQLQHSNIECSTETRFLQKLLTVSVLPYHHLLFEQKENAHKICFKVKFSRTCMVALGNKPLL
jgi:hypothetical protein